MHKVYISGALTDVPNPNEVKKFYEAIGRVCIELGLNPYVPHLKTDPIKNSDVTPHKVFVTDKHEVTSSDLLISYVGLPSLGVGMELAYAETVNLPIILLYERNARVSRFPRGIPNLVAEIRFRNHAEALEELKQILVQMMPQQKIDELHIEVNSLPRSTDQYIRISGSNHQLILEQKVNSMNGKGLIAILEELNSRGIIPKKVYIEPFANIGSSIQSIWENAEILYTYR